jgi:low temperature requirement protein LtrA
MTARATDEPHRAATQLELLFDLTFVIAIASLAGRYAHALADGHALEELVPFLQVFFSIWWAWINFTWFASSFDTDDVPFRLPTMVQIAGVLDGTRITSRSVTACSRSSCSERACSPPRSA